MPVSSCGDLGGCHVIWCGFLSHWAPLCSCRQSEVGRHWKCACGFKADTLPPASSPCQMACFSPRLTCSTNAHSSTQHCMSVPSPPSSSMCELFLPPSTVASIQGPPPWPASACLPDLLFLSLALPPFSPCCSLQLLYLLALPKPFLPQGLCTSCPYA